MFPSVAPRGNIEILGKQNKLFPSGPVIKCLFLCFGDAVAVPVADSIHLYHSAAILESVGNNRGIKALSLYCR